MGNAVETPYLTHHEKEKQNYEDDGWLDGQLNKTYVHPWTNTSLHSITIWGKCSGILMGSLGKL